MKAIEHYPLGHEKPVVRIKRVGGPLTEPAFGEASGGVWAIEGLAVLRAKGTSREKEMLPMTKLFEAATQLRPYCWQVTTYPNREERAEGIDHVQYSRLCGADGHQRPSNIFVYEGFWGGGAAVPGKSRPAPRLAFGPAEMTQAIIDDGVALHFGYDANGDPLEKLSELEGGVASWKGGDVTERWLSAILANFQGCLYSCSDGEVARLACRPEHRQQILESIVPGAVEAITSSTWYIENRQRLIWDEDLGQLAIKD